MHFYLFPAFTHKRFEESRVCKKLSPHLHRGNCFISETVKASAREPEIKEVRNACKEQPAYNWTASWETMLTVWVESHYYVYSEVKTLPGKALRLALVKKKNSLLITSMG